MARDEIDVMAPDVHVRSIRVTCLGGRPCTSSETSIEIVVTTADGAVYGTGYVGWESGPGATAPPADAKTAEP